MSSPATTTSSGSIPPPKPGLVEVGVDGEIVVYDPEADLLHHLDRTASVAWASLDGDITLQALAERVAARYGVAETTARRDVADLAGVLWQRGLLRGSTASAAAAEREPVGRGLVSGPLSTPPSELGLGYRPLPDAPYRTRGHCALAYVFEIATNDVAVRDYLDDILIDLTCPAVAEPVRYQLVGLGTADGSQAYLVLCNGEPVTATSWLDRAIAVLLWHINAAVVRSATPRYVVVHAAAAVTRGITVLLPAPTEGGKTTAVAGLVRAGFGYLTDEAVAIDPDTMLAQPYPKPLSIDRGSWNVLADLRPPHHTRVAGQWQLPPRLIRSDAVAGPAPVRFVVTPAYNADSATRLEPMSRAEMLMTLADSTFQFQDNAERNLAALARIVTNADCYRLPVSDLNQAVRLVEELVTSEQLDVAEGEPPVTQRRH